jgi:nucleoside-diphosphate-sugar epimerase
MNEAHAACHEVVAIRRKKSVARIPLLREPHWIEASLDEVSPRSLEGVDALIHLASHGVTNPTEATWEECFKWNVTASLSLWLKAIDAGVRRFVICGSCFEYGRSGEKFNFLPPSALLIPTGPYHSSKAAASTAAVGLGIDRNKELIILRPFHVYGEGEAPNRFWPSLRRAALAGDDFAMTAGLQVRDFINVTDVARGFIAALTRQDISAGQPIIENIGSGRPQSLADFAAAEWKRFGARGSLLTGAVPMRPNEVMRFVPALPEKLICPSETSSVP